jgi:serine/threonine protein kinase
MLNMSIPAQDLVFGEVIGQGSFGKVCRGTWRRHTDVAIKQLRQMNFSREALEDFKREAAQMAVLNHPNIVRLYGICLNPYALVMELLPNVSLFDLLQSGKPLNWTVRRNIIMDMGIGLDYLHERDVVHCDFKSLNVLLDDRLRAKVCDFGLTFKQEGVGNIPESSGDGGRGSLPWMAPELFEPGGKNTKASDMYAFGMVVWEVVTGKVPFSRSKTAAAMISRIKDREEQEIPANCPVPLHAVIQGCHRAAEQRPAMNAVLTRLKNWKVNEDGRVRIPVSDLFASARDHHQSVLRTYEARVAQRLDYEGNQGSFESGLNS